MGTFSWTEFASKVRLQGHPTFLRNHGAHKPLVQPMQDSDRHRRFCTGRAPPEQALEVSRAHTIHLSAWQAWKCPPWASFHCRPSSGTTAPHRERGSVVSTIGGYCRLPAATPLFLALWDISASAPCATWTVRTCPWVNQATLTSRFRRPGVTKH